MGQPVNGNWLHIRYQTRTQAQSALSRSGRVLGGTLMIGVALANEADAQAINTSAAATPGVNHDGQHGLLDRSTTAVTANTSSVTLNPSGLNTPSKSIRPLAQAYKATHNEHEISLSSTTSTKNDGIATRAM